MNYKPFSIPFHKNPDITMNVIPGHFTTSNYHLTHYLDLDNLKTNSSLAREVGVELASPYLTTTLVDTIVCMEGTELIGAYLAEELLRYGTLVINSSKDIYVVTPMSNSQRQLVFQDNKQKLIDNHNIILLISSISSGITLKSALECLAYYGGKLVGISALFSALDEDLEPKVHSLFRTKDIPGYEIHKPGQCDMCKAGRELDAIILHGGYTNI